MDKKYTYNVVEDYREINTRDYIRRYCEPDKFIEFCKKCDNYGKVWACPPFNHDTLGELKQFKNVLLVASRITPEAKAIPLTESLNIIHPERMRLESWIRNLEKKYNGKALAFAGNCLYCPSGTCTRKQGKPCRHPELVRPSLEAYGFDIGKTMKEIFETDILWSTDGNIPEYLTLVVALFHNEDLLIAKE